MKRRRSRRSGTRKPPSTVADTEQGDVVRLGDGVTVVRILWKYHDGDAHVRGYRIDGGVEHGPEYQLGAGDPVILCAC